jgi:hypothetical protein
MGKSTGMEIPLILFQRTLTDVVNSGKSLHWELAIRLGVCTLEIMLRLNQGWQTGRPSSPILIQSAGSSMQVTARRMYGSEHFLGQWPLLMILILLSLESGGRTTHYYLLWTRVEVVTYVLFASYHKYSLHIIGSDFVAK